MKNITKAGFYKISQKTENQPFPQGFGGCEYFRIPGLIRLRDGRLFATADARYTLPGEDYGGIDTIYSVSGDEGKTWQGGYAALFPDSECTPNDPHDATTCIDPMPVEAADGSVHIFVNMNPTGYTTGLTWPKTGTGFINILGKRRLAVTANYENTDLSPFEHPEKWEYFVGDYSGGIAPILKKDGGKTGYSVDEYFNIYDENLCPLTQKQTNSGKLISQNLFYKDSAFHVFNTMYTLHLSTRDFMSWHCEIAEIKTDGESGCVAAPGNGTRLKSGELVLPFYTMDGKGFTDSFAVILSKDLKTLRRSVCIPQTEEIPDSGECKAVELDENTVRMFFRNGTKRICYADLNINTLEWATPVRLPVRVHSGCNFSAIMSDGQILVSYPEGVGEEATGRLFGKVFVFDLDEKYNMTLKEKVKIIDEHFSYSVLCKTHGGVLCLYDTCEDGFVVLKKVNL